MRTALFLTFFLTEFASADPILGTNPAIASNLRITTFASGLNFPYGLYQLPDGSILAATSNGGLFDSTVQIERITQTNGVARTRAVVFTGGAGPATGLTGSGNIVVVAAGLNSGSQILLLQAGAGGTLIQIAQITFSYPAGFWDHDSHTVAMRALTGQPNAYQLIFSVGSQFNDTPSLSTVGISGLVNATLNPDSVYSMTFTVSGSNVTAAAPVQVATGLRNGFALGFNARGDVYIGENGIDFNGTNVPVSSDNLDIVPLGSSLLNFGFPNTYFNPVTGAVIGNPNGLTLPFASFLPIAGAATQGVSGLALSPPGFPSGLNNGVFFGFYGRHAAGPANDLNGVVYVDLATGNHFDFLPGAQAGISHPNSLLATSDALYIADLSITGSDTQNGAGVIYKVTLVPTDYLGYIDTANCQAITGWAADRNRPDQSIVVSVYDGASLLGHVTASGSRSDVGSLLEDNGLHGFSFVLPSSVKDGSAHLLRVVYETSSTELPGSPKAITCGSGVNYAGFVDTASCSGVIGWVADRNRPNVPIVVSLWDGSTLVASTTANGLRADVGTFLGDNGLHGFTLTLPPGYGSGVPRSLQVRYESSSTQLYGSPFVANCGSSANYAGYVDSSSCSGIVGWVADRNRLNVPITVSLWDGLTQIASTTANSARADVGAFLGDNGLHAFKLTLPSSYANGIAHSLQVRYEASASQVPNGAVSLTCSSSVVNYAGYVDSASCGGITGWAADRNRPNVSIVVSLWDGVNQIASTTGGTLRGDVGAFLGDNGSHGFSLPIPVAYANGLIHSFQIRYEASSSQLPGSPVALTCGSGGPNYTGSVDVLSCSSISGWAADRNAPNSSINVNIYDGGTLLQTLIANGARSDVGAYLGDSGAHGFGVTTPKSVKDGQVHTITVRAGSSLAALYGPQSLTCQP